MNLTNCDNCGALIYAHNDAREVNGHLICLECLSGGARNEWQNVALRGLLNEENPDAVQQLCRQVLQNPRT